MENNHQVGCQLGISDHVKDIQVDEDGCFVLNRFCMAYRPDDWLGKVAPDTDIVELVKDELRIVANFCIEFNYDLKDLEKTLNSIKNMDAVHPNSTLTIINDNYAYNPEITKLMYDMEQFKKDRIYIVFMIDDTQSRIDQAFKNMYNGYVYHVNAGYEFPKDLCDTLRRKINFEMVQPAMIYSEDRAIFNSKIFHTLGGNMPKGYGDHMETRPFIERLRSAPSKTKTIFTWEEFFDSNNNSQL